MKSNTQLSSSHIKKKKIVCGVLQLKLIYLKLQPTKFYHVQGALVHSMECMDYIDIY